MPADQHAVEIDGHRLTLKNLDKVLYPQTRSTKGELLHYVTSVAPTLLPHLAGRPTTRKRWPDGVEGLTFFEKNVPKGTPSWVRTVVIETPGSSRGHDSATYPLIDDLATLVWVTNLAALELHVPQWTVGPRGGLHGVNRLVIDLDPGAPAGLPECAEVAHVLRERLADDGLEAVPVTSGSKGMQLYASVADHHTSEQMSAYAKGLAEELEKEMPKLVTSRMTKALRPGKIFLDWSQNNGAKTTISPYSPRGRAQPTAAAPRSWDELDADLTQLTWDVVLDRVATDGDLAAPLLVDGPSVPL